MSRDLSSVCGAISNRCPTLSDKIIPCFTYMYERTPDDSSNIKVSWSLTSISMVKIRPTNGPHQRIQVETLVTRPFV